MSQSSIAKKLLIKPGQKLLILDPPTGYLDELGELPAGVEMSSETEEQQL